MLHIFLFSDCILKSNQRNYNLHLRYTSVPGCPSFWVQKRPYPHQWPPPVNQNIPSDLAWHSLQDRAEQAFFAACFWKCCAESNCWWRTGITGALFHWTEPHYPYKHHFLKQKQPTFMISGMEKLFVNNMHPWSQLDWFALKGELSNLKRFTCWCSICRWHLNLSITWWCTITHGPDIII